MQEKRALLASFAARASLPPQTGPLSDARAAEQRFARLRVRGRYDSAHQVLLENIVHDGRPGYYVLTPLRTAGAAVLVNHGWLPANPDRSAALPALRVAETTREVSGRIEPLPVPGLRLASPPPAAGGAWLIGVQGAVAALCTITSCCSTRRRRTVFCATGGRPPASAPRRISVTPYSGSASPWPRRSSTWH